MWYDNTMSQKPGAAVAVGVAVACKAATVQGQRTVDSAAGWQCAGCLAAFSGTLTATTQEGSNLLLEHVIKLRNISLGFGLQRTNRIGDGVLQASSRLPW
jgi:hypothetical protein